MQIVSSQLNIKIIINIKEKIPWPKYPFYKGNLISYALRNLILS